MLGLISDMRKLVPWVAAFAVLVALWPTLCMTSEGGPTTCQSAVALPLPWGESADSWGMIVAAGAAALTFLVLRRLLRRRTSETS